MSGRTSRCSPLATTSVIGLWWRRWTRLAALVPSPESTFAVVMTSAADRDAAALRALLPLRLRYLGLMGAKRKVAVILGALTEAEREEFRRQGVRAPAGIEIGSHSPEEIAVSVAAEIIADLNGIARN